MTGWRPITRLLSVGSIVADIRTEVPALPARGGDVFGTPAEITAGGAFNVLAAAARLGLPTAFGGCLGTGPFADRIAADLAQAGIAVLNPPRPEGDNGFCLVMVEPDGERTFVTSPGLENAADGRWLDKLDIRDTDAVFVSGYDLSVPWLGPRLARWIGALPASATLLVDPGPLVDQIAGEVLAAVLARADLFSLNRRELTLLTGKEDIEASLCDASARLRGDSLFILRDGAAGCMLAGGTVQREAICVSAPAVRMVDATGAGDTHSGAFIASIANGFSTMEAAARANAAAALSVTRRGPATAPTTVELDRFLGSARATGRQATSSDTSVEPATTSAQGE